MTFYEDADSGLRSWNLWQDSDAEGSSTPRRKSQDACHQEHFIVLHGKSWQIHRKRYLCMISNEENLIITDTLKFHKEVPTTSLDLLYENDMLFLSTVCFNLTAFSRQKSAPLQHGDLRYLTEALEKEKIIPKRNTRKGKISRSRRSMIADELVFLWPKIQKNQGKGPCGVLKSKSLCPCDIWGKRFGARDDVFSY